MSEECIEKPPLGKLKNLEEERLKKEWKELFHPSNVLHGFTIYGYEAIERTATPVSAKSYTNRVYVPGDWTRVMVVRLE